MHNNPNMIQKTAAFTTQDGQTHATIEEAQKHELAKLIGDVPHNSSSEAIAEHLIAKREQVLEILTATGRKPRTRPKANGGKRRKSVPAPKEAHKEGTMAAVAPTAP